MEKLTSKETGGRAQIRLPSCGLVTLFWLGRTGWYPDALVRQLLIGRLSTGPFTERCEKAEKITTRCSWTRDPSPLVLVPWRGGGSLWFYCWGKFSSLAYASAAGLQVGFDLQSLKRAPYLEGDDRGWDGWMASLTQGTWVWVNSEREWNREAWRAVVHGATKSRTRLRAWTMTASALPFPFSGHGITSLYPWLHIPIKYIVYMIDFYVRDSQKQSLKGNC